MGGVNSGLGPWECNNNYGVNMGGGTSESLSVPPPPYSQPVVGAGSKGGGGGAQSPAGGQVVRTLGGDAELRLHHQQQ